MIYLSQNSIKYLEDVDINLNSNFKVPENTVLQMFFFFEMWCLTHVLLYLVMTNQWNWESMSIDDK